MYIYNSFFSNLTHALLNNTKRERKNHVLIIQLDEIEKHKYFRKLHENWVSNLWKTNDFGKTAYNR